MSTARRPARRAAPRTVGSAGTIRWAGARYRVAPPDDAPSDDAPGRPAPPYGTTVYVRESGDPGCLWLHAGPDDAPAAPRVGVARRLEADAPDAAGRGVSRRPGRHAVTGPTYPVRHLLKQLGCWFAGGRWGTDDAAGAARAQAFVDAYADAARAAPAPVPRADGAAGALATGPSVVTVARTSATGGPYRVGEPLDTAADGTPLVVLRAHRARVAPEGARDPRTATYRFWAECAAPESAAPECAALAGHGTPNVPRTPRVR